MTDDPVDVKVVLRDPDDDCLVALARHVNAEAIVTSDRDLLDHSGLTPSAISPREADERVGLL